MQPDADNEWERLPGDKTMKTRIAILAVCASTLVLTATLAHAESTGQKTVVVTGSRIPQQGLYSSKNSKVKTVQARQKAKTQHKTQYDSLGRTIYIGGTIKY